MAEPTEGLTDRALPEPEDWLEWVPDEVEQAMRKPRFRRLTHTERMRLHDHEVPAAYLRPRFTRGDDSSRAVPAPTVIIASAGPDPAAPPEPAAVDDSPAAPEPTSAPPPVRSVEIDGELSQRLVEVEGVVSRAAQAVDRRAEHVRTMLAQAIHTANGSRPS